MRNITRARARLGATLAALLPLLLVIAVLTACEDARVDERGVFVGPAPRLPPPSAEAPKDAGAPDDEGVAITGRVVTDEGRAVVGRAIVVADARGKRTRIETDAAGTFHVADVVAPYDLAVAGAAPTVFLGVTREDPWIELFERDGPSTRPPAQPIRLAVKAPPCAGETCSIAVVTASPSGEGAGSASYRDPSVVLLEIEHAWNTPMVSGAETIAVHVLTSDAARTAFAYAHTPKIPARPGEPSDLGTLEPEPVRATASLTVRADARGLPAAWEPTLATWLELPGGGSMSLTYAAESERTLHLPVLAGGGFRASAWMQHPSVAERSYFHVAAHAWSGVRPIAGGAVALDVLAGPSPVRPAIDGRLSRRGLGLAWRNPAGPPPLSELTLTNVTGGSLRYRIWTTRDEVSFAELEQLGVGRPEPGDHVLGLVSTPDGRIDEVIDPDVTVRRERIDPKRAGAATYQRFGFRVTQ